MTVGISLSLTEENYLKIIYSLGQQEGREVLTNEIAAAYETRAATVTDMLKKLADKGLVEYQRYHGATLTPSGQRLALQVIRRHRIWETFLVEKLGFGWEDIHPLAEDLEHVRSEELINRLEALLGFPTCDPHGDPIPDRQGNMRAQGTIPLEKGQVGMNYCVVRIIDHQPTFLGYLARIGLVPGSIFSITSFTTKGMAVKVSNESTANALSLSEANAILVKLTDEPST